jgi:hypothetical protein
MRKLVSTVSSFALVIGMSSQALAVATELPDAQGPGATTLAAMETQCDTLAAGHGAAWSGEVDLASIDATLTAGPTEVLPLDRDIDESSIEGHGTFTPSDPYIAGDPYRIGGSVNMFGIQRASAATWSNSRYDYTADFETTFTYSFNCTMTELVHIPVEGRYVVDPELIGTPQAEAVLQACNAFNDAHDAGADQGFWGNSPQGNCVFEVETPAHDEEQARDDEAGTPVNEIQTDTLQGHEENGGPVEVTGDLFVGQVVVCISPKKPTPGGTWQTQNGYTGNKCTTTYFNEGHWDHGSQTSNGTYISVPIV